jgi:hypothetical protein
MAIYATIVVFVLTLPLWLSNSKLLIAPRRHHRDRRGVTRSSPVGPGT